MFTPLLYALLTLLLVYLIKWYQDIRKCNIPGPAKLPFFGSIPFIPSKYVKRESPIADYMAEKWGDISAFYLANNLTIYISDIELVKKVYKMEEGSGRPSSKTFSKLRFGEDDGKNRGLLLSSEEEWKEQRRFSLRTLKDMGFGKASMEDSINCEVQKLIDLLSAEHVGKPTDLRALLNVSIVNALWVLMSGESLELKDEKLLGIVKAIDKVLKQGSGNPFLILLSQYIPAISKLDRKFQEFSSLVEDIKIWVSTFVQDHKNLLGSDQMSHDFISTYLDEVQKTNDTKSSFHGKRGEESLIASCLDLFLAGTETTTSSLIWGVLFLLHNPDVQEKVHQELDKVLGAKTLANYDDRFNLPYTCAVINEIHRKASIVHNSLPHTATKDLEVNGYTIPKGATIVAHLIGIHHDQRYWEDPHKFYPERFISSESGACLSNGNLIPFSYGKRYCLGQSLAEKELFMFFVGLMKTFHFAPVENDVLTACDYHSGTKRSTIRTPPIYNVVIRKR